MMSKGEVVDLVCKATSHDAKVTGLNSVKTEWQISSKEESVPVGEMLEMLDCSSGESSQEAVVDDMQGFTRDFCRLA